VYHAGTPGIRLAFELGREIEGMRVPHSSRQAGVNEIAANCGPREKRSPARRTATSDNRDIDIDRQLLHINRNHADRLIAVDYADRSDRFCFGSDGGDIVNVRTFEEDMRDVYEGGALVDGVNQRSVSIVMRVARNDSNLGLLLL